MFEVQRDRAWYDIVTLDEPWFNLSTEYEFVWLPQDEKFPKENDPQFNRRIHAHDRLESERVPFNQGPRKRSQVQRRRLYRRDIKAIVPKALN
jgi:hypothetical protein